MTGDCLHRRIILRQDANPAYGGGTMEFFPPFHYCTDCGVIVEVTPTDRTTNDPR